MSDTDHISDGTGDSFVSTGEPTLEIPVTAVGAISAPAPFGSPGDPVPPDQLTSVPPPKIRIVGKVEGYEIESGVDIPTVSRGTGRRFKYPLDHLQVNQSIFLRGKKVKDVAGSVHNCNRSRHPSLHGKKFISRVDCARDPNGEPLEPVVWGVRIWRVS